MGYSIARECLRRGAEVVLVSGPTQQKIEGYEGLRLVEVESAQQMYEATKEAFARVDMAILCAAVADYTPKEVADKKIKRQSESERLCLELKANPDIAAWLGKHKRTDQVLVGFALETDHEEANAQKKLQSKGLDWIVLNSLQDKGAGFGTDTNKVSLYGADGTKKDCPLGLKETVSEWLVNQFTI